VATGAIAVGGRSCAGTEPMKLAAANQRTASAETKRHARARETRERMGITLAGEGGDGLEVGLPRLPRGWKKPCFWQKPSFSPLSGRIPTWEGGGANHPRHLAVSHHWR